jgi:signal recognition particle GTPase
MSDLEKELPEIPLPKPKKKVKTKAKQSAKQAIARTRKKVAQAEQSLRSAKAHAKNVKDKLLTINKVLDGKEQQLVTKDVIDEVPSNVREHVAKQNVIFEPNSGPQTDFLAASEREVFLRWC